MANIHYSSSFLEFLHKSQNPIAQFLYELDKRAALRTGWSQVLGDQYYWVSNLLTNEHADYLTFRSNGLISYLPGGKVQPVTETGEWSRENRQEGRPSKVIRKIMTKKAQSFFSDKDFENFANEYKANFSAGGYTFKIEDRTAIPAVYNRSFMSGGCSLQNSCMQCKDYFDIYANCECLQIITLTSDKGELAGRALLWDLEYEGKSIKLMDRIYAGADHLYELFIDFAKENGFWYKAWYKSHQSKREFITPEGTTVYTKFTVETKTDWRKYPYIDTFSYGGNGYLTNSCVEYDYEYDCTGGGRTGDDHSGQLFDEIDNVWTDEDDMVLIDAGAYAGTRTHYDNTVEVGEHIYYLDDPALVPTPYGPYTWILKEDAVYSDFEGEWIPKQLAQYVECHKTWAHKDNTIEICGEMHLRHDLFNQLQLPFAA